MSDWTGQFWVEEINLARSQTGVQNVSSKPSGNNMVNEEQVLAALDKPRAIYPLKQLLDPSSKSTDALQDLLMRMRAAGKVKFDIKTGKWSKAQSSD